MVLTKLDSDNQLDMVCYELHKLMDMINSLYLRNHVEIDEMQDTVLNIFSNFKKLEANLNDIDCQYKLKSLRKILTMFYTYYASVPVCKIALDIFCDYLDHTI